MTVEDAAKMLGVGRSTAYRAAAKGELPAIKIGDRWLVIVAAFEQMLSDSADKVRSRTLAGE